MSRDDYFFYVYGREQHWEIVGEHLVNFHSKKRLLNFLFDPARYEVIQLGCNPNDFRRCNLVWRKL